MNVFYFSKLKPQFIECILSFQEETKLLLIRFHQEEEPIEIRSRGHANRMAGVQTLF